jgi:hypothetical protein
MVSHDKDTAAVGDHRNTNGSKDKMWLKAQHPWNFGGIQPFTGDPSGLRIQERSHVNKDSVLQSFYSSPLK